MFSPVRIMLYRFLGWTSCFFTIAPLIFGASAAASSELEINSPFAGMPLSLDADSSGEHVVTTNSERSIAIWTKTGEDSWDVKVIRSPFRKEFASAHYLAAISPDAKFIAFSEPPLSDGKGGFQRGTAKIYILDALDEHIVTTLSAGIPTRITRLRFSADGQYLGAMLGNGCGHRIWTREQWMGLADQTPKWSDDESYSSDASTNRCCDDDLTARNCESLPDGVDIVFLGESQSDGPWLLTLSETGLRTYAKEQQNVTLTGFIPLAVLSLKQPHTMALSSDNNEVAIGDTWSPKLAIADRVGKTFIFSHSLGLTQNQLSAIGKERAAKGEIFLPNPIWVRQAGKEFVYAFGYFQAYDSSAPNAGGAENSIVVFDNQTGFSKLIKIPNDPDTSTNALARVSGATESILFLSAKQISLLEINSDPKIEPKPKVIATRPFVDLRGQYPHFNILLSHTDERLYLPTFGNDGRFISLTFDYQSMRFSEIKEFKAADDFWEDVIGHEEGNTTFYNASANPSDWSFGHRIGDKPPPAFFGHPLSTANLSQNDISRSGVTVSQGTQAIWGTDRALRIIDHDGEIVCTRPIESPAWRMNVTNDGKMIIVAHGDGILRWYRLVGNADVCLPLVASLYVVVSDTGPWGFLAWLPNGKFMTDGGVGTKDIACYPVPVPNGLSTCVPVQRTDVLYDPAAVIGALSEALSSEGSPQDAVLEKIFAVAAADKITSIDLKGDFETAHKEYDLTLTISGGVTGTRYLAFNDKSGTDIPYSYLGNVYSASNPLKLSTLANYDVTLSLPDNLRHHSSPIDICPSIFSKLLLDDSVDPGSQQKTSAHCLNVIWNGNETTIPTKQKLWALLIGFSGSSHLAAAQLKFAHEDVLNLARFFELEKQHKLPGQESPTAPDPYFDDIKLYVLISSPDIDADIESNPKVLTLQNEFRDATFEMIYRKHDRPLPYDKLFSNAVADLINDIGKFQEDHKNDPVHWQHSILIYFSGHGFIWKSKDPQDPRVRQGLITPSSQDDLQTGVIWLDDVESELLRTPYLTMLIIDACRSDGEQSMDSELAGMNNYSMPIDMSRNLFILYSSTVGHYSYEDPDYSISDFVPQLTLWPTQAQSKGGGLFSLGLLAALACGDALEGDKNFTIEKVDDFLVHYFFSRRNQKWMQAAAKIKTELSSEHLVFMPPQPDYENWGPSKKGVLREGTVGASHCFSEAQ